MAEKKYHYAGIERTALEAFYRVRELEEIDLPLPHDAKASKPQKRESLGENTDEIHSNIVFYWEESNLRVRIHLHGIYESTRKPSPYRDWRVQYVVVYDDPEMTKPIANYSTWYSSKGQLKVNPVDKENLPSGPGGDGLMPKS